MKDMTKASNPIYLAFFLLLVCGVSTLVMAYVAAKTKEPIMAAEKLETNNYLEQILPASASADKGGHLEKTVFKSIKSVGGEDETALDIAVGEKKNKPKYIMLTATAKEGLVIEYSKKGKKEKWEQYEAPLAVDADDAYGFRATDNKGNIVAEKEVSGNKVTIYVAYDKDDHVVGYAAESKGRGFGGDVNGLVSFEPDGTIDTVIVKSGHAETPGIGTKVTERANKRTISDVVKGVKPDTTNLPPNPALDSYAGVKPGDEKWTKEKDAAHFVSGATYSSNAVRDLVWDAATAVRDYIAAQGGAGSADVSATQENAGSADASATQPESNEQPPAGDASSTAPEQTENKEEK